MFIVATVISGVVAKFVEGVGGALVISLSYLHCRQLE